MRGRLKPTVDFHQPRFMQISESHCGPAVIQMLLSRLGIDVTQAAVAEAGGAANLIAMAGTRAFPLEAEAIQPRYRMRRNGSPPW